MKIVQTDKAPAPIGPYSQAIVCAGMVYTSGQIPLSPVTGEIIGSTISEQAAAAIENLKAVLEAAGSSAGNVVKTTCFLADMADFAKFNEVYAKTFTGKPSRSCIEASALPRGVLVEIEAIAYI